MGGGSEDETKTNNAGTTNNTSNVVETEPETQVEITYTPCTVDEMVDMLEENALKAEKTYQDQYIELTGKLSVIDSDGSYILIVSTKYETKSTLRSAFFIPIFKK